MERIRTFLIGASFVLFMVSGVILIIAVNMQDDVAAPMQQEAPTHTPTLAVSPTETFPPTTPLPSLTPSQTLRPPPTFEPPTMTLEPSFTPTITMTATFLVDTQLDGVHGLETATPSSTPGCKVRSEWTLTYEVQALDALERIADQYGVSVWELAEANCLDDMNVIVIGQQLRVPGDAAPGAVIECVPWEVLTPINGAFEVDGNGNVTFNWRGPIAPRNLIRVYNSDGEVVFERTVDLRQNEVVNLRDNFPDADGTFTWYVYPLDANFMQIHCLEGGPWVFHKTAADEEAATGTSGTAP
jgi:LysM repeat protein